MELTVEEWCILLAQRTSQKTPPNLSQDKEDVWVVGVGLFGYNLSLGLDSLEFQDRFDCLVAPWVQHSLKTTPRTRMIFPLNMSNLFFLRFNTSLSSIENEQVTQRESS